VIKQMGKIEISGIRRKLIIYTHQINGLLILQFVHGIKYSSKDG